MKHYSFDLWLTLIKSNPKFKEQRNLLFYRDYNPRELCIEDISAIIRKVDVDSNICCEITGIHIPCEKLVYDILQELGNKDITNYKILKIKKYIQGLFIRYHPSLYDEYTLNVIKSLYGNGNILSIGSNTGFILGSTLDLVLDELKIRKYFKFALYSDELNISKPNPEFFKNITIRSFYQSKIVHIGDNVLADGGCVNSNIDYFQINSNNKTIIDLLNYE